MSEKIVEEGINVEKVLIYHEIFTEIGTCLEDMVSIEILQPEDKSDFERELPSADFLIISVDWEDRFLDLAEQLKWIQSISAGFDMFPLERIIEDGVRFSTASGIHRIGASEHVMGLILSLARNLHIARDAQREKYWARDRLIRPGQAGGKTLGIVGLGEIGSAVAEKAKYFEMEVLGVKRDTSTHTEFVDELYPPEEVAEVLSRSDFLLLACPLTSETKGWFGLKQFELMQDHAYLINIARGEVVVEDELVEALEQNAIAGAGLDVFETEPLSPQSRLWDFENVIITPHYGGANENHSQKIAELFAENYRRYRKGKRLKNEIR